MVFDQAEFDIRCEWGLEGVRRLAPISDAVIVVDVLSFCTCVEIATARDALVFPYPGAADDAPAFAAAVDAELAGRRGSDARYSLSPQSIITIAPGTRLVLPSPNGSTLTLETGDKPTFAGCLRNARAVAAVAQRYGPRIAVIPAGERWGHVGDLRPALEDWIGAGAIISHLPGARSPEAQTSAICFEGTRPDITRVLRHCSSGQELIEKGWAADVALASALDVSDCVPLLHEGAYVPLGRIGG